jgi:hypothetical protein
MGIDLSTSCWRMWTAPIVKVDRLEHRNANSKATHSPIPIGKTVSRTSARTPTEAFLNLPPQRRRLGNWKDTRLRKSHFTKHRKAQALLKVDHSSVLRTILRLDKEFSMPFTMLRRNRMTRPRVTHTANRHSIGYHQVPLKKIRWKSLN